MEPNSKTKSNSMEREVSASATIGTDMNTVSKAINGLLNLKKVSSVYGSYHVDMKKERKLQDSEEKRQMRFLYKNIRTMDLRLTQVSEEVTRMDYCLQYNAIGLTENICMFLTFLLFAVGLVAAFFGGSSAVAEIIGFFCIFWGLLYLILIMVLIFHTKGEKNMNKMFHKLFMLRLVEYIKIVKEHETEKR